MNYRGSILAAMALALAQEPRHWGSTVSSRVVPSTRNDKPVIKRSVKERHKRQIERASRRRNKR